MDAIVLVRFGCLVVGVLMVRNWMWFDRIGLGTPVMDDSKLGLVEAVNVLYCKQEIELCLIAPSSKLVLNS